MLMRPINLLIVVLTMVVTRYVVVLPMAVKSGVGMKSELGHGGFAALVLAAVLLTAAGNMINDYFDLRVDQINKPEKIIVGKKVKRRVAIVLHQVFNLLAVLLTAIVCATTDFWWPILIPISVATLLWFYSPVLKKKWLIGNVVVALCTALVPYWSVVFDLHHMQVRYVDQWVDGENLMSRIELVLGLICLASFLLNLIREALKDAEDVVGDASGEYNTLPLVSGLASTVRYTQIVLAAYLILMVFFMMRPVLQFQSSIAFLVISIALIVVPGIVSFVMISRSESKEHFTRASATVKWTMLLGLIAVVILSRMAWY
ncbi:MAG: hypothetical protein RLZZ262_522 [Bacteroidota bacterium]|jgi:4-hydroxybenzoate polyprenyltransferase